MYIFNKKLLPFDDLDGARVEFKLSGRMNHNDMDGIGKFDIISSDKPDYIRMEIVVRPMDGSYIRIPLARTMVRCIKKAPAGMNVKFQLFFRGFSARQK